MMRFVKLIIAALLVCTRIVSAHQPYESSTIARLDRDELELTVTTSLEIAGQLVEEPISNVAALENLRPKLLEAGAELYEVTTGGRPLVPGRIFFTVRDGEAVFSVLYPFAKAAELRFRAAYLNKLPIGYGGSLEVYDYERKLLGYQPQLMKGATKDAFSVPLPPPDSNRARTPLSAEAAERSRSPAVFEESHTASDNDAGLMLVVAACAVLLLAGLVWRLPRPHC